MARVITQTTYIFGGIPKPQLECQESENQVNDREGLAYSCDMVDAYQLVTDTAFESLTSPLSLVARADGRGQLVEVEILGQTLTFEPTFKERHNDGIAYRYSFESYQGVLAQDLEVGAISLRAGDLIEFSIYPEIDRNGGVSCGATADNDLIITMGSSRKIGGVDAKAGAQVTLHVGSNGIWSVVLPDAPKPGLTLMPESTAARFKTGDTDVCTDLYGPMLLETPKNR